LATTRGGELSVRMVTSSAYALIVSVAPNSTADVTRVTGSASTADVTRVTALSSTAGVTRVTALSSTADVTRVTALSSTADVTRVPRATPQLTSPERPRLARPQLPLLQRASSNPRLTVEGSEQSHAQRRR